MSTKAEILSHFQLYNIHPEDTVLNKCTEICVKYKVDPEDFVDQWCAYTASNLHGAPPSLDALDKMERKEFQKQNKELNLSKFSNPIAPKTPKNESFADEDSNVNTELQQPIPELNGTPSKPKVPREFIFVGLGLVHSALFVTRSTLIKKNSQMLQLIQKFLKMHLEREE